MAREAEVDGGVDQRLHDQEDVRRAGARDGGRHGHHLLVVDLDLDAQGAEEVSRLLALLGARLRRRVPHRHPFAEASGRVGHCPDDLVVAERPDQGLRGRAGEDRQDDLAASQPRPDLAPDAGQHLGLDREDDDIRVRNGLGIAGDRPDAVVAGELLPAFGTRVAGHDTIGLDELAAQQAGDHGLGHDPRSHRCDRCFGDRRHGREYSRGPARLRLGAASGGRGSGWARLRVDAVSGGRSFG